MTDASLCLLFWQWIEMMPNDSSAHTVQLLMIAPLLISGLSHIFQPKMWRDFFGMLHNMGTPGVVFRTYALELTFATIIVAFHQVWQGPGIIITIYGCLLMTKCLISALFPKVGMRSLAMSQTAGNMGFRVAGVALLGLGGLCIWLVWGETNSLPIG
ncbi:MAG: hypothetical protein AAF986_10875 [Pseudomonadota bacterium]